MIEPAFLAELPGWELCWIHLAVADGGAAELTARRERVAAELRAQFLPAGLGEDPTFSALRQLFKAAGTDPARYRPSSEALVRRLLKGDELPAIHPLVDLNNQLSIELKVPSCVMRDGSFAFPVTLRSGRPGEVLDSMRGALDLAGKPLLADADGPFGTPITDAHRVKVLPETVSGWLVAYLPAGVVSAAEANARLDEILAEAPVARRE
ncbi:MAG: phenylalanine--tRNA ligase beta subunit-related protein [Thermoanaerobaculia bacterium]